MIEIIKFKPFQKNSLQGILTIKIPKWGNFIIYDIAYFVKENQRWISFPSKSYESEGKTKYFSLNRFEDQAMMKTFQEKVLESLDKYLLENKKEETVIEPLPIPF